jgi:hypothetical protein
LIVPAICSSILIGVVELPSAKLASASMHARPTNPLHAGNRPGNLVKRSLFPSEQAAVRLGGHAEEILWKSGEEW